VNSYIIRVKVKWHSAHTEPKWSDILLTLHILSPYCVKVDCYSAYAESGWSEATKSRISFCSYSVYEKWSKFGIYILTNIFFFLVPTTSACVLCTYKSPDQGVTKRCRLSLADQQRPRLGAQMRGEGGGGELRGLSQYEQVCTWSPNKLWRSNSIFNL
jgi:hypothetical protein